MRKHSQFEKKYTDYDFKGHAFLCCHSYMSHCYFSGLHYSEIFAVVRFMVLKFHCHIVYCNMIINYIQQ